MPVLWRSNFLPLMRRVTANLRCFEGRRLAAMRWLYKLLNLASALRDSIIEYEVARVHKFDGLMCLLARGLRVSYTLCSKIDAGIYTLETYSAVLNIHFTAGEGARPLHRRSTYVYINRLLPATQPAKPRSCLYSFYPSHRFCCSIVRKLI